VASKAIICTAGAEGRRHDFRLMVESGVHFPKGLWTLADSGYQGLQDKTGNALLPFKGSKHNPLTSQQKVYNRKLASARVIIENIIRFLKRFKILADRYRNRRKRFGLRFNLIAAIYNQELKL
jgi:hypothetical protein